MNIILANGTVLEPLVVTGEKRTVQGMSRDTLCFVFPGETELAAISAAFTPEACESITIESEGGSYLHRGYTIPAELSRAPVEVSPATAEEAAVYQERVTVAMSQRTWAETQLLALTDTVDVLVMESLMKE